MSTLTPLMSLVVPTIGIDSGLVWEQSMNANSSILDGHNHSIGSGSQIGASGIFLTSDLPFNDNNAITLRSCRFTIQPSPLSQPTDLACIYFSGFDFYINDANGNQIQVTKGGTVNATSSGISSGTASASFVSSTLVVDAASNTPANIQGASLLLGNTGVANSFYLTLSPPSALSSNYSLVLPPLPPQTNVMTLDTSGNMNSISYDQVGQNMTSVGANAIQVTTTRQIGGTVGTGGVALSGTSGFFSTSSTSFVAVTGLTVSITTSGRPVVVMITDAINSNSFIGISNNSGFVQIINNNIGNNYINELFISINAAINFPSQMSIVDFSVSGLPGTYIYSVNARVSSGNLVIQDCVLVAYEL
jgi:hypothetical protein